MKRRTLLPLLLISLSLKAPATIADNDRPQALVNAERARANITTADITCSWEFWAHYNDQDRRFFNHATSRVAEQDCIWIQRGDDAGVVIYTANGLPSQRTPINYLYDAGRLWESCEDAPYATAYVPGVGNNLVIDPRTLGVSGAVDFRGIEEALWLDGASSEPTRYSEYEEDGLIVVTGQRDGGAVRQWWIDPRRGWNPVRVRYLSTHGWWSESRSTLEQLDGVWFPEKVEYYTSLWKDGEQPRTTYTVHDAKFNHPDQPHDFTPADIGIVEGTILEQLNEMRRFVAQGTFNGHDFVPFKQYVDDLVAQQQPVQPPRTADDCTARMEKVTRIESEWEAYTRRFIERYALNEDQAEKAWQILKDCQSQANSYLTRRRQDLKLLDDKTSDLARLPEAERATHAAAILQVLDKVAQPLDDIFEKRLRPRLDKLPTRKQRQAADPPPPTKPADQTRP